MARRRGSGNLRIGSLAGLIALVLGGQAVAQVPPPPPAKPKPPPSAPDPVFEAAKAGFEALPEVERKGLQDALAWTGDYNSVVTGTFGRRTYDALLAYRKRAGSPALGLPDAGQRRAILAAGEAARKAVRFTVKPDAGSGAVLGVPERLLPKRATMPGGTRWQSTDGRITLETKSFVPGETDLDALFERLTAPAPERRVTYKLKRPDFLVATSETATGKSYIRYAAGPGGIRGFTVGYDTALAPDFDRIVIAVANSYVPFPDAAGMAPPASAPGAILKPPASPIRGAAPAATGLVVGPGRVLTSAAAVEGCASPRVAGAPARVVKTDTVHALALLETVSLSKRPPALPSPRDQPVPEGEAIVVLGADGEGGVAAGPGEASAGGAHVFAPLQPGAGGAPVFDRSGKLVGLVLRFPAPPRLVAGVVPPARYAVVPGGSVAVFLSENGLGTGGPRPPTAPGSLGFVAGAFTDAVAAITCQP